MWRCIMRFGCVCLDHQRVGVAVPAVHHRMAIGLLKERTNALQKIGIALALGRLV